MNSATELADDEILTTADIAAEWRVLPQTVAGWCKNGVLAPDGSRLKLRRVKVGGVARYFRADWEAFLAALNHPDQEAVVAEARGQAGAARAATRRVRKQLGT